MIRSSIGAALVALSLGCVTTAKAEQDTMVVKLGDLNVASQKGAEIALRRIRNASAAFCGGAGERDLGRIAEQQRCVARMMDKSVASLNAPMVSALYGAPGGVQLAARSAH